MTWHCNHCGHWHGHAKCAAITQSDGGGVRKCGCQEHSPNEIRITA